MSPPLPATPRRSAGARRRRARPGLLLAGLLSLSGGAADAAGPAPAAPAPLHFQASAEVDLEALVRLVADRTPALQEQWLAVEQGRADLHQSHLLENPTLDVGVGTLPLGPPNPPDLPSPLTSIPNYGAGLSLHPDLARRGPRQARAHALLHSAEAQLRMSVRERALGLAQILGTLAATALRLEGKRGLLDQARGALGVAQRRVQYGYGTPLEMDRAEIDLLRLEQEIYADEGEIALGLAACADFIAARCEPFPSANEARSFLERWLGRVPLAAPALEERADLRVLSAQREAAEAEARLARAQAVPDPTLHVGYLYDSFVASGNQRHSMSVGLNLPLPVFDHGQAAAAAAAARSARLHLQRDLLLGAARARVDALLKVFALQRKRREVLQQKMLPRAQAIQEAVRRAFEARALALTEVLQARRSLDELLVAEADSLSDSFHVALAILGQIPEGGH